MSSYSAEKKQMNRDVPNNTESSPEITILDHEIGYRLIFISSFSKIPKNILND